MRPLGCATPSAPARDGWAGAHPLAPPPETPGAGLPIRDEGDFAAGFGQRAGSRGLRQPRSPGQPAEIEAFDPDRARPDQRRPVENDPVACGDRSGGFPGHAAAVHELAGLDQHLVLAEEVERIGPADRDRLRGPEHDVFRIPEAGRVEADRAEAADAGGVDPTLPEHGAVAIVGGA